MNKDSTFRKQIADTLRHCRRVHGYSIVRDTKLVEFDRVSDQARLIDIIKIIQHNSNLNIEDACLSVVSETDYDDCTYNYIALEKLTKQTDQEYFESVCEYLLPTPYQTQEYDMYKRLKHKYEGILV